MGLFDLGPAGAVLGTTLSQVISVIIAVVVILKRKKEFLLKGLT